MVKKEYLHNKVTETDMIKRAIATLKQSKKKVIA